MTTQVSVITVLLKKTLKWQEGTLCRVITDAASEPLKTRPRFPHKKGTRVSTLGVSRLRYPLPLARVVRRAPAGRISDITTTPVLIDSTNRSAYPVVASRLAGVAAPWGRRSGQ